MSNQKFETFKQEVLSNQPTRVDISLNQMKLIGKDRCELSYIQNGVTLTQEFDLTPSAIKDILSLSGMNKQFVSNLLGSSINEETVSKLITLLRQALSANKSGRGTIVINGGNQIIKVYKEGVIGLPNNQFFDLAERAIDRNNLIVEDLVYHADTTTVTINTKGDGQEFGLRGLEDEYFTNGLSMCNSPTKGVSFDPYVHRLVCTNGMIGSAFKESVRMTDMKPKTYQDFYAKLTYLERKNFIPSDFETQVREAINTPASVSEVLGITNLMKSHSIIEDQELFRYLPQLPSTVAAYQAKHVHLDALTKPQQKYAKTNMSVWDAINGLTDFASHDDGYSVNGQMHLQRVAGDLLTRTNFDCHAILDVDVKF